MMNCEYCDGTGMPFTFDVSKSEVDGTWVIHIDTEDSIETSDGPRLRVYINDGNAIYENPPFPGNGQ